VSRRTPYGEGRSCWSRFVDRNVGFLYWCHRWHLTHDAVAPALVEVAFQFGPAEYFSLMLLGLLAASTLTTGSPIKGVAMVAIGLLLGVVGTDVNSGVARFTFGVPDLQDGLALVAIAMGFFGVADVLANANRLGSGQTMSNKRINWRALRLKKVNLKLIVLHRTWAGFGSFSVFARYRRHHCLLYVLRLRKKVNKTERTLAKVRSRVSLPPNRRIVRLRKRLLSPR